MAISESLVKKQLVRFQDELFDRGLRLTKQRESIFCMVLRSGDHLSAEDLHRKVRDENRSIGFATVYRTLRLLVDVNLVEVRQFGDGVQRYESAAGDHHDHMVCLDCRKVFEFENDEIERLQHQVAEGQGFEIARHRLDLYVRCRRANCPNIRKPL
ncbi:MAG: transcriptional repressor [Myxococcota bacterium]|jgi:Fur family ferric uptake transcriptional regulator|nr:transcriptional repressor [Myxococcota bacterium]